MFRTGIALFALAAVATLATEAHAPGKDSTKVVTVTAKAGKIENDTQTVTFTIDIEKTWHLYANPVQNEKFAENAVVVAINGGETKLKSVKITYPPGMLEKDADLGDYMIYEDKVVITAKVVRAMDDMEPLKATIKLNACSFTDKARKNGVCLPTGTVELKDIK